MTLDVLWTGGKDYFLFLWNEHMICRIFLAILEAALLGLQDFPDDPAS